jgi:hypothetical protein
LTIRWRRVFRPDVPDAVCAPLGALFRFRGDNRGAMP